MDFVKKELGATFKIYGFKTTIGCSFLFNFNL